MGEKKINISVTSKGQGCYYLRRQALELNLLVVILHDRLHPHHIIVNNIVDFLSHVNNLCFIRRYQFCVHHVLYFQLITQTCQQVCPSKRTCCISLKKDKFPKRTCCLSLKKDSKFVPPKGHTVCPSKRTASLSLWLLTICVINMIIIGKHRNQIIYRWKKR